MKKSLVLKIVFSVVAIILMVVCTVLIINMGKSKYDGTITIIVENGNSDGTSYINKKVGFNEGDSLYTVLTNTFTSEELVTNDTGYGAYITKILALEEKYETEGMYYISFYINDTYSTTGVSSTSLNDKDVITFKLEYYSYNG